jgi:hypothetical protein
MSKQEGTLNYLPFSAVAPGNLFRTVDATPVLYLKTTNNACVSLESLWVDGHLIRRGTTRNLADNICVVQTDESIAMSNKDPEPVNPRRVFWKAEQLIRVGRDRDSHVHPFAGLYLYAGFGTGTYFSGIANEVFEMSSVDARQRAKDEGVLFVYFDSAQIALDPTLASERRQAAEWHEEIVLSAKIG